MLRFAAVISYFKRKVLQELLRALRLYQTVLLEKLLEKHSRFQALLQIIAEDKTETLCFGDEGAPYQAKQLPVKERSKVPLPGLLSPYRPARCQAR